MSAYQKILNVPCEIIQIVLGIIRSNDVESLGTT